MHLAYLEQSKLLLNRREALGAGVLGTGIVAASETGGARPAQAALDCGPGKRNLASGEKWINAFFREGSRAVADHYADTFVFEDIILAQMIDSKAELLKAFEPFDNNGPNSPLGVHRFDIIRYNGGRRGGQSDEARTEVPNGYDPVVWAKKTRNALVGIALDYDEWAIMHWLWTVDHNADFLGMPARGKTTATRGVTHHLYKDGKIVQEYSYWDYRDVAIQLGVIKPPSRLHELSSE